MKDLYTYITEEQIDEGLFKSSIGFIYIKRMTPEYLLNGILNMYEYIIDKSDIKLFYEDFPLKERPFWTNLYKLYESKLWSIFDATKDSYDSTEDEDEIADLQFELQEKKDLLSKETDKKEQMLLSRQIRDLERKINQINRSINKHESDNIESCFDEENELINVTPEFRRQLRNIIKDSSNPQDDLNSANVNKIMLINDPQFEKQYIFTINKVTGIFRKGLKLIDVKMIESLFKKISEI